MQTDDMLRTLHADKDLHFGDRIAKAMERIADALEMQVTDQHDQASFSRLLLKGLSPDEANATSFEDYWEGPNGDWWVLANGERRPATLAEEQEIADMNQRRKRR